MKRRIVLLIAAVAAFLLATNIWLTIVAAVVATGTYFSILLHWPEWHARTFNVGLRVAGIWFSLGGIAFLIWSVVYVIRPEEATQVTTLSASAAVDAFLVGSLILTVGGWLLRRPSYRPDLGDVLFSDRIYRLLHGLPKNWARPTPQGYVHPKRRRWWTGDPY